MARLIALKQTAPERFLAQFDTGEALRTTLAVVTDYHLSCGRELTAAELDALRAASERSRCRQRALRIIGTRAMSVKELTDRLKERARPRTTPRTPPHGSSRCTCSTTRSTPPCACGTMPPRATARGASAASSTAAASRAKRGTTPCRSCRSRTNRSTPCCAAACAAAHTDRDELRRASDYLYRRGFGRDEIRAAIARYQDNFEEY